MGTSTDDPARWFLGAVERARRQRQGKPGSPVYDEYLNRTLGERMGIEAVAEWWANQSADINNVTEEESN